MMAEPVYKTDNTALGIRCADHVTPLCPKKLSLTSPTSGVRSVGMVHSRTQATEFVRTLLCDRFLNLYNLYCYIKAHAQ
jgi:hypothetical protein